MKSLIFSPYSDFYHYHQYFPSIIMKLEILFGLLALMLFASAGGEANTHKNALLHGAVSMAYSPSQKMGTIRSTIWKFHNNGTEVFIVDTTDKPYYTYDSQFKGRINISSDLFTLTIMDLTKNDSGIYTIVLTDIKGKLESTSFNVTVYEPVPHPNIRPDVKENTTDRCNVTLYCSVPSNTSDFSYTWKSRQGKSENQLHNNGKSIQMSLTKDSRDMEILCIVHNPADQRKVSIQVQEICGFPGEQDRSRFAIILAFAIAILILAIFSLIIIWKRFQTQKG